VTPTYSLDSRPTTPPADYITDPRWVTLREDGSPFVCGDRFVVAHGGWKEAAIDRPTFNPEWSANFGHGCVEPVPWLGAACRAHSEAVNRALDTRLSDIPDASTRKPSGGTGQRVAKDPEVVALIAEATAYLNAMADRRASTGSTGIPDFILTLIADRERKGPAYFRVTENMAAAIIRTRDAAARREADRPATPARDREDEAKAWVLAHADRNDFARSLLAGMRRFGSLTQNQYDAVLRNVDRDAARTASPERPAQATQPAVTQDGWYQKGADIFKVQRAVHGSGNLYAKRLVVTGPGEASWEYAPGMVRLLTEADRLTVEAAASFGRLYGVCAVCGRTLTDEGSIEAGIGPVCINKVAR
jgi:hypothetical protein